MPNFTTTYISSKGKLGKYWFAMVKDCRPTLEFSSSLKLKNFGDINQNSRRIGHCQDGYDFVSIT